MTRDAGSGGETFAFDGFASVTDPGDGSKAYEMWDAYGPYYEIIARGAFLETLSREPDVPLVISHDQERRLARTGNKNSPLYLTEVIDSVNGDTGLKVYAPTIPSDLGDAVQIAQRINLGLISEMSFAFAILSGRWSADWMTYTVSAVDIHRGDVSVVGFGANPWTSATMRGAPDAGTADRQRLRAMMRDVI